MIVHKDMTNSSEQEKGWDSFSPNYISASANGFKVLASKRAVAFSQKVKFDLDNKLKKHLKEEE